MAALLVFGGQRPRSQMPWLMRELNEWTKSLAFRNILLVLCTRPPLLIQFAYFVAISASTALAARLQTFRREKPIVRAGTVKGTRYVVWPHRGRSVKSVCLESTWQFHKPSASPFCRQTIWVELGYDVNQMHGKSFVFCIDGRP